MINSKNFSNSNGFFQIKSYISILIIICSIGCTPSLADDEPINWQEAVSVLARERSIAEACVGALKRHGNPVQVSRGELVYGEAKGKVDAVISSLIVALATNEEPYSWPQLQTQMLQGFEGRLSFCRTVHSLLPNEEGKKSGIIELVGEIAGSVIEGVTAIFIDSRNADVLTRKTIQTQLEAAKWTRFSEIVSSY